MLFLPSAQYQNRVDCKKEICLLGTLGSALLQNLPFAVGSLCGRLVLLMIAPRTNVRLTFHDMTFSLSKLLCYCLQCHLLPQLPSLFPLICNSKPPDQQAFQTLQSLSFKNKHDLLRQTLRASPFLTPISVSQRKCCLFKIVCMVASARFPDVLYVTRVIVFCCCSSSGLLLALWLLHLVATLHYLGFEQQGGGVRKKVGTKHAMTAILSCAESALGYCCPFIAALWWQVQQSLIRTASVLS